MKGEKREKPDADETGRSLFAFVCKGAGGASGELSINGTSFVPTLNAGTSTE